MAGDEKEAPFAGLVNATEGATFGSIVMRATDEVVQAPRSSVATATTEYVAAPMPLHAIA